ncbi:MAG: hypothetical protein IJ329_04570 [Clostridia bacterium]|nr:hypothetical protein [Clostridia bacterium]
MKKQWLVLGLAAIMSFGCLIACGDGDDGDNSGDNNTNNVIIGEQVTKEQWKTAFDNIDFTYAVTEWRDYCKDDYEGDIWEDEWIEKNIYFGSKGYCSYYECEDAIVGVQEEELSIEEEWYINKADGSGSKKYSKTEEDVEEKVVWTSSNYTYELDEREVQQYIAHSATILYNILKLDENIPEELDPWECCESVFEQDIEEFTFDEATGVYHQDWKEEYEDEDEKGVDKERLEVMFLDGKVYSIKGIYTEDYTYDNDETEYWESTYTVTFKKEVIPVPGDEEAMQDEEAVLDMWETYSGTYKFESLTIDGVTYKVGDTFDGRILTEDSEILVLKEDGTAIYSLEVYFQAEYFAWWIEDGNLILSHGGKENRWTGELKDNKIVSRGSMGSTCWKKYN